ncbi:uncharacterized protein TrAFT101_011272 [Trichoderma asperellum]|uniref:Uncharacterized protein n=1 Tax=Trichoderma asperellum (strain ATCC 204424 / CBS 433.97 / NBRC 101777) TaxID=1042311 RepID=A0A2T3YSA9_TRIA4|nr:hypothetical protein M441DRAFT_62857 [Trichoderma asperellum CBS 433.97]PTB35396.1 hypothetical protein M441DRAFT_62857 [Trichoderma asperellum CBS 433.97]UKZ96483.1 hypothetical protein TrAFT101_011272 [Trichoderma asperellum]
MASALETLNQLASSAAKAVWGDSNDAETHKEPISGATGDVSKGEPYDAGNLDPQAQSKVESRLSGEEAAEAEPSELADDEHYTLSSSKKDKDNLSAAATTTTTNDGLHEPRGTPTTGVNPEEGKPLDELTGKGPRPIEIVAKENGGNAAAATEDSSTSGSAAPEEKKPETADAQQNTTTTATTNDSSSKKEATDEEYVKSSGLAADGGDFDAAKPGAGLEADRLMEQKGIKTDDVDNTEHKDQNSSSNSSTGRKSSDSSRRDKPKLKERIKNKLHMHGSN